MGGSTGRGNVTPYAEFNAWVDPEALALVVGSGIRFTMVGLNVTHQALVTAEVEMKVLSPFAACSPIASICTGTCWDLRSGQAKATPGSRESVPIAHRLKVEKDGFIAFGHVARAVAMRARAFGVRMLAYDPYIEELVMSPYGVEPASLGEVLQRSDIVSMHAPATPDATRMMTAEHFRQMKPTALFINTGRGPTVDESALVKALQEGWIAGAGLDVLEQEPPVPGNPLLTMDNVILTAHVASASARFDPARRRRVGHEISLVLNGRWPRSCVNPTVLNQAGLHRWQPFSMERGPGA